jgi:hypothetical protein
MKMIDATKCPWGFGGYFGCEESVFVMLKEPITLQLKVQTESGVVLPRMAGADENLDKLLDLAVDGAENDLPGLVLLRDCLVKWTRIIGDIIDG